MEGATILPCENGRWARTGESIIAGSRRCDLRREPDRAAHRWPVACARCPFPVLPRPMFKRHHQVFTALRVLLDVAMVAAAFAGAYAIRFGSSRTFPYPELPPLRETLTVGALALFLWPLALRGVGLYRPQRQKSALDEVFGVFKATVLAGLLLVAITYFVREDRYSRGALLIFTALAFVGVGAMRFLFKEVLHA